MKCASQTLGILDLWSIWSNGQSPACEHHDLLIERLNSDSAIPRANAEGLTVVEAVRGHEEYSTVICEDSQYVPSQNYIGLTWLCE